MHTATDRAPSQPLGMPEAWRFFRALADLRAGELVAALHLPANAVSYHLTQLRGLGLLQWRRSSADARDVYFHTDIARLSALYRAAGDALHPALASQGNQQPAEAAQDLPHRPLRVLFLCTHNSSRSQMAEGLLRARGGSAYAVYSAGTHPRAVHPLAIQVMAEIGIDISGAAGYRAKSMSEFSGQSRMDLVVTVCDEAAEECPFFPGARRQEHWNFPDPSAATGSTEERLALFRQVRDAIAARIDRFLSERSERAAQ